MLEKKSFYRLRMIFKNWFSLFSYSCYDSDNYYLCATAAVQLKPLKV